MRVEGVAVAMPGMYHTAARGGKAAVAPGAGRRPAGQSATRRTLSTKYEVSPKQEVGRPTCCR